VGVTQGGNKWCHPPPADHSKSLVIFVNLHPKYTKKQKEKTIAFEVKAFKNYIKVIIMFIFLTLNIETFLYITKLELSFPGLHS